MSLWFRRFSLLCVDCITLTVRIFINQLPNSSNSELDLDNGTKHVLKKNEIHIQIYKTTSLKLSSSIQLKSIFALIFQSLRSTEPSFNCLFECWLCVFHKPCKHYVIYIAAIFGWSKFNHHLYLCLCVFFSPFVWLDCSFAGNVPLRTFHLNHQLYRIKFCSERSNENSANKKWRHITICVYQ